ncbi:MAG: efflux RND transporter permease subunit [Candidatus Eremiobacteraeota bacterium]|nr:efflux RND transporter permease subunit [Candidatus Eremiobacteraeota bacterium]
MWLTRFAINRWVITTMVFAALVIFGLISFTQLGRSSNPPGTDFPVVVVSAGYPGASPQDMERMVIKPIEDQMTGLENMDELDATAQEGGAAVVVIFKMGTDLNLAAIDVQRRVDVARTYMPSDLNPPDVTKEGQSEPPLLDIAISSNSLSQPQIADMVNNQVSPLVQQIANVQSVDVRGTADREFQVRPNPTRLVGIGATLTDVYAAVAANNVNVPGGIMTQPTQEGTVAIHSYIDNASDILGIPLMVPGSANKNMHVGDVSSADDSHVEMRSISHYNGQPRVYMSINPTLGADQIKSTQTARARMAVIEAKFPQLQFHEIDAPADYTAKSLWGVGQTLIEGIFLTAIVMLLFLHAWRNAVVVFLAIPTSILATFILMRAFNFHIDSLSMMGLSLIIGILVDDSIVVLENITRHRDMGAEPMNAAINGRTEIGSAAIAITMVDVIVFLPIAFLPGIVGAYLKEFAAVVVIATLFSLLVSFTLTPLLAARWSVMKRSEATPKWLTALDNRLLDALLFIAAVVLFAIGTYTGWYLLSTAGIFIAALLVLNAFVHRYERVLAMYRNKALPFALAHGSFVAFVCSVLFFNAISLAMGAGRATIAIDAAVLGGTLLCYGVAFGLRRFRKQKRGFASLGTHRPLALLTLLLPPVLCGAMVLLGGISTDFVPQQQDGSIGLTVTYPAGTPIATTNKYVVRLEEAVMKINGIKSVSSTVGRKQSGHGSVTGGNYATLNAQMADDRIRDTNKASDAIRKLGYLVPGAEFNVAGDSGNGSAIFYALTGPDDQIGPAAEKVAAYLRSLKASVNVQTSAESGAPRLNVDVDRARCALLGINPSDAANVARIAVDGAVATKVRTSTGLVDVRVQFPSEDRNTVEDLKNVRVRAQDGTLVPLGSIATFAWTKAPTKIERMDRERVVNVLGDILPGHSLGEVSGPLEKKLAEPGFLPEGVGLKPEGNSQFMVETFKNMGIALVTSFLLVYMLMVILYGSFLEPFIVMFSVPLAVIGALTFLAFLGRMPGGAAQSLNIISMLGIVMLFGLVAKNGILLVDYSNTLCKRGMRVRDAVLQASGTRFRPIIMTTAAMIFGMLPLALGYAEGGEWRQAIGTVIIGGLTSSLVLTLFLVPMVYNTWMGGLERRADRKAVKEELAPSIGGTPARA